MHRKRKRLYLQVGLFVVTFITTTLAGAQWVHQRLIFSEGYSWQDFASGLPYSVPLLLILTVHEFGHYFMARFHRVKASLPYYIPFPPIPFLPINFGTMGAVIRLRSRTRSNIQTFDIGLAGPLTGFVVALVILFYAFQSLPSHEYVFQFHPEYEPYGENYADVVYSDEFINQRGPAIAVNFGPNLIFWLLEQTVSDESRIPNGNELMHYPVLVACYIALFFTCLNLLPIGQLDGGHVLYGLFGFRTHRTIARIFFIGLTFYSGLGLSFIDPKLPQDDLILGIAGYLFFLYLAFRGLKLSLAERLMYVLLMFAVQFSLMVFIPGIKGYEGWLLFALILGRFIGIEHPPSEIEQPLDPKRVLLGWIALGVFVLCFSPAPFQIQLITGQG